MCSGLPISIAQNPQMPSLGLIVLSMFELFLKVRYGKDGFKSIKVATSQESTASLCTPWQPLGPQHLEPLRCCPVLAFLRPCPSYLGRISNENYVPHGLKVVQHHTQGGLRSLMQLESRWRQHFLDSMQPRHLPQQWSVDHNHQKLLRKYGEDLPIKLS